MRRYVSAMLHTTDTGSHLKRSSTSINSAVVLALDARRHSATYYHILLMRQTLFLFVRNSIWT